MKDKAIRKYVILLAVLFAVLIFLDLNKKEPVQWISTYINTEKNPYGTYICYKMLPAIFPDSRIEESRIPITNRLKYFKEEYDDDDDDYTIDLGRNNFENTSYIFISHNFGQNYNKDYEQTTNSDISSMDIKNLLKFVEQGNNVFIAAENIPPLLSDTLEIRIKNEWSSKDTAYVFNDFPDKQFAFSGAVSRLSYFQIGDSCTLEMRTLAETTKTQLPVFLQIKHGDGFIYLSSMPVAFSNYVLLKPDQYEFAFTSLSYLPKDDTIIWDEYLKQGRIGEFSSFRVIWNHPALLFSYYIVLLGAILFVFFRAKRTQRIIPVIKPPENTSVEFLNTLSNLYYQKQAYDSILEKRHTYFLETVRSRFYMHTENIDDEFITNLSLKSGVNIDVIKELFSYYYEARGQYYMSNTTLLKYSEKLEEFYRGIK